MKTKGNQKHLILSQRIEIEKSLLAGDNFAIIARKLNKDPSTVSKEIRRHSKIKERKNINFAPIPCSNRNGCTIKYLCEDPCETICTHCPRAEIKCIYICPNYMPKTCLKLSKPPYVCNGCGKRTNCLMEMKVYSAKYADDGYREMLVSSREGINQTPDSLITMDALVSPLIRKGQSIAHIYSHHAADIGCSRRTLYNYLDQSVLTARNLDLRRRVKYKKRKTTTRTSIKDRVYRESRNYSDFQKLIKEQPHLNVVEMDTVEGLKGGKVFLTMMFRNCSLMLIFLLKSKTQMAVQRVYDDLTLALGPEAFNKIFQVILTDGGSEFQNPSSLEEDICGNKRTSIYYCDPYSSWQKGRIEKNHEYIRLALPKGKSFEDLTDKQTTLLQNHINSEARDSLNGCSPFKLSQLLLDQKLHQYLNLKEIAPDDVFLRPELLK
ncbi:transposase [Petrocella atlantisensis]|uniref:Transposase n=1 Tax=Petrocella atlantisensis TaxID=2173034 RepID=A0A3P7NZ69_9FIRM|nr:IS30 family transposase [Petrocella atlantisensis]VDN46610.1 transposase [Petrocella atlantisensis]